MKNNITLKKIEEMILTKQERHSRYISSINSLFEKAYNNYIYCYCNDDEQIFKDIVEEIADEVMIPDASFENQNLFLIKKLVLNVLKSRLTNDNEFYIKNNIEDFFDVEIFVEPWDDNESWPKLQISPKRNIFTKRFNIWYNSPIFVDENGIVKLFDTFGDKRFGIDKEYFDKLDSAKLGTYLQYFHYTWDKLQYLCGVITDDLNGSI